MSCYPYMASLGIVAVLTKAASHCKTMGDYEVESAILALVNSPAVQNDKQRVQCRDASFPFAKDEASLLLGLKSYLTGANNVDRTTTLEERVGLALQRIEAHLDYLYRQSMGTNDAGASGVRGSGDKGENLALAPSLLSEKPRGDTAKMPRTFEYLLNSMEAAAQEKDPSKHGYAAKRRAVFQYVEDLFSDYLRRHNDACDLELAAHGGSNKDELLRRAAKLLWSHNGAGQDEAWKLSNEIDAALPSPTQEQGK